MHVCVCVLAVCKSRTDEGQRQQHLHMFLLSVCTSLPPSFSVSLPAHLYTHLLDLRLHQLHLLAHEVVLLIVVQLHERFLALDLHFALACALLLLRSHGVWEAWGE